MADDRTAHFNIPLPSPDNLLSEDVTRLRDALTALDAAVASRATPQDIQDAIAQVVNAAPVALNTIRELADAIGDDANFAANIAAQVASAKADIATAQADIQTIQTQAGTTNALVYASL